MNWNEALAVLDCTIRMGEVRADHNDKEGREALSVLRAVCEDYEKARPLLEAVRRATPNDPEVNDWDLFRYKDDEGNILRAALAYREGRKA